MKKILSTLFVLLFCGSLFAQNNVISVRPGKLATGTVSLGYERVLIPKLTAKLGVNFMIPTDLMQNAQVQSQLSSVGGTTQLNLDGFAIQPEIRFYPGLKETPRGFYLGAFFKYGSHTLEMDPPFTYDWEMELTPGVNQPITTDISLSGNLTHYGGGIMIGSQWLIADKFSIDVTWFGVGFYPLTVSLDATGNLVDPATEAIFIAAGQPAPTWGDVADMFADDLESGAEQAGVSATVTSDANGFGIELPGAMPALRGLELKLGFAF